MTSAEPTSAFFQALERFEARLETPVVPGELMSWASDALAAADETGRAFDTTVAQVHDGMYAEIVEQDPGSQNRVDEMRADDHRLLSQLAAVLNKVSALSEAAGYVEPDEAQLADQIDAVVEDGLKFVIDSRKQEHALETWYMEAFDRDRGDGD